VTETQPPFADGRGPAPVLFPCYKLPFYIFEKLQ